VQTFVIGIAAGFVGVTGAVDVGSLNNNNGGLNRIRDKRDCKE